MKRYAQRRWLSFALVAVMLVALVGSATQALANLTGSTFEGNDGNLVVDTAGNTDWANVAGLNTGIDNPSGSGDNAFGQGAKEDSPNITIVDGSIPPNKNDLTRFYEASQVGGNNHMYLYLGWERLVNIGNANLDFEINQSPTSGWTGSTTGPITINRTPGDLLVTYDFGGSGTPTLGLNTWLTSAITPTVPGFPTNVCFSSNSFPCWGDHIALGSSVAEGAVNTSTVTDPFLPVGQQTLTTGLFGEAAIDLTAAGVFQPGICEAFGSTFVKSRSSSSFGAELKDFIAPVGVNITNCGTVTIVKHTDPGGINQNFGYTSNLAGTNMVCTADSTPASFTLNDGAGLVNTETCTGVPAGNYTVTEGAEPAHFALESLTCQATGGGSGVQHAVGSPQADITVAGASTVTCTYVNNHLLASPTVSTLLSATTGNIGDTVHDSATLTGATSDAGGTVTYRVYSDNACSALFANAGSVTVTNGVVPDSNGVQFNAAGTYYWQATYSGDFNNAGPVSSLCTSEVLVVNPNNPGISTAQNLLPNDSATITGATSNAGGTITFNLYSPSDGTCSATPALTQQVGVSGNGTYNTTNTTFLATTEGTWKWKVIYSGDANNNGTTSACGVEQFTIANH